MKTTPDGRPYATLQFGSLSVDIHPKLWIALKATIGNGGKFDGQIVIRVSAGKFVDAKMNGVDPDMLDGYVRNNCVAHDASK